MRSSSLLCFGTLTSPQGIIIPYLYSLDIGLTILGSVIYGLTRQWPQSFRHGAGYEEAADMRASFFGQSAGGGKGTTAVTALASKRALAN
jgi:hypothetical protein